MMRIFVIILLISVLLPIFGCQPVEQPPEDLIVWRAEAEGLALEAGTDRRDYVRGQTVALTVTASNTSGQDMTIAADSGALVFARLWRRSVIGWEQVKRYPQTAVMVASLWRLPAGAEHVFTLNLPIEPDWPTGEPLRLTVELNGRADVAPGGLIRVFATQAEYDEALGKQSGLQ